MYHLVDIQRRKLLNLLVHPTNWILLDCGRDIWFAFFEQLFNINVLLSNELRFVVVYNFDERLLILILIGSRMRWAWSLLGVWPACPEVSDITEWVMHLRGWLCLLLEEVALGCLWELSLEVLVACSCLLLSPRWRKEVLLASSVEIVFVERLKANFVIIRIIMRLVHWITPRGSIARVSAFPLKDIVSLISVPLSLRKLVLWREWHLMKIGSLLIVDISQGVCLIDTLSGSRGVAIVPCNRWWEW